MLTEPSAPVEEDGATATLPRVAVVITTYDHARFLNRALDSILGQTVSATEIIVVDDGSNDDPGQVVAKFPGVTLIAQSNQGLAAARNAGLRAATAELVLFLDADDALCPNAIETGLEAMLRNPGAGFVYGAYRLADVALRPTSEPQFRPFGASAYYALLRDNFIGMHAAVLYDREKLVASGGFDTALRRCEDYDAYLRLARNYPVGCHPEVVALYRMHDGNMSSDPVAMLHFALEVHGRHKPSPTDRAAIRAWHGGRRLLKLSHANQAWKKRTDLPREARRLQRGQLFRSNPGASAMAAIWQTVRQYLPAPAAKWIKHAVQRALLPLRRVDMGDLARTQPISRQFGFDRGTPVDRYYIETFLAANADAVRGRVLEIGDSGYSRRFGRDIARQDVLHVSPDNPEATIVGDLTQPGLLPEAAFDCLIATQTLHLIYDVGAAVGEMYRALKPGGTLLLTVPGVSSVDPGQWSNDWLWSITGAAAERLFEENFGPGEVAVEAFGNVYAATCFLQGLALEEVQQEFLQERDPSYPLIVTVRARREG